VEFAFRARYNLPPTDPRFLDATLEMMLIDFWSWAHHENPKLRDELFVSDDFDADLAEMEAEAAAKEAAHQAAVSAVPPDGWEDV
jgi:hypothetical protein